MRKNPVQFSDFVGLNNVDKARETEPNELQTAVNVDVNDQGRLERRDGYRRVYKGEVNSLFSDGNIILFREQSCLRQLNTDYSSTILRSDIHTQLPVSYLGLNGLIYYSDGNITGVVQNGANRSWGLLPPPTPIVEATGGDFQAGDYIVTVTYERNDGQESGSPVGVKVNLPTGGGLAITGIVPSDDPTVDWINIYISAPSGEVPYRSMRVANEATEVLFARSRFSDYSMPLKTELFRPPPPGDILAHYNGRIYIVDGSVVWYTEPYKPELINMRTNLFPFPDRVTMCAPSDNGIWFGTESRVYFAQFDDPQKGPINLVEKANYGVIHGTAALTEGMFFATDQAVPGPTWLFATPKGICMGTNDGMFMNITEGRYHLPDVERGVSVVNLDGDRNKYLVGLYYSRLVVYPNYQMSATTA